MWALESDLSGFKSGLNYLRTVTLNKLFTTLNLSPFICEMGLRGVCVHVCVVRIERERTWRASRSLT